MGQYQHNTYRGITMARGILVTMLYKKASTTTLSNADPANSLTLMSADVERITNGWQTMHEIWANSAEIGLAIWLLERQLGVSCAVPVGVALCKFTLEQYLQSRKQITNISQSHWSDVLFACLSLYRTRLSGWKPSRGEFPLPPACWDR